MDKLPSGEYFIYLRKSRADLEAESRGEGETLAKHRTALYKLAKHHKLNITETYEEIASGESLFHRPQMLKLLEAIESRKPKGVLAMDVDRFGRGNMQEQGLILEKFRDNNVLIITPRKIYDLSDEFDEEYSEFEAFMARKELKIINRRLQSGRVRSAEEGNYIGTRPPFGYKIAYNDRGERFLEIDPEQANVVRMIFQWYADGLVENGELIEMGAVKIARRLDQMGVPTYRNSTQWNFNVILQMLRNEVYIGRIQWKKTHRKKTTDGAKKYQYIQVDKEEWVNVQGKHEAIINQEIFDRARIKLEENLSNPVKESYRVVNPLAGLIKCGKCGRTMVLKPFPKRREKGYSLICNNKFCDCKSTNFDIIEERILLALKEWLKSLKMTIGKRKQKEDSSIIVKEQLFNSLRTELKNLEDQKMNLFDLLERKIYDEQTFLERSKNISERIQETNERIERVEKELKVERQTETTRKDLIPTIQDIINQYKKSSDPQRKNMLIKQILVKVIYLKEKFQTGDDFEIRITPRMPRK